MLLAESISPALSLALSYLAVAALPGPNFVVVSHAGLAVSRSAALRAACGVAIGAALLTALAALLAGRLPHSATLAAGLDVLFAALLLRLSVGAFGRAWMGARDRIAAVGDQRYFRRGLLCALANPFTAAFLVATTGRTGTGLAAAGIVFVTAILWFGSVGFAACHPALRAMFARRRGWAEAIVGLALLAMAGRALAHVLVPAA